MGWVLLEIIVPLILAGLVGLFLGWLLWRWRRTRVSWSEWQTTTDQARSQSGLVAERDDQIQSLLGERDELISERDGRAEQLERDLAERGAALSAAKDRAAELDAELRGAQTSLGELETMSGELAAARARVSELEGLQGDLETTRLGFAKLEADTQSETADLRSQLDQANARLADVEGLQGRLDASERSYADLQDKAVTQTVELQERLDAAHARIDELEAVETDLASSKMGFAKLEADTQSETADLRSELDQANARLAELEASQQRLEAVEVDLREQGERAQRAEEQLELVGSGRAGAGDFVVKGNVDSMLYHRPDSRNYGATVAEVWFASAEAAEAAGFSLASTHPDSGPAGDGGTAGNADVRRFTDGIAIVADPPYGEGSHAPLPDDGAPAGFTIKGNVDSMLYHRPDSRNYGATVAEVWFDTPDRAEAAGFTLANTHPKVSAAMPVSPGPYGEGSHAPLPDDGAPAGFTIKGNVDSMLYHRPDSRNYGATVAEVWFDTPDRAEAAGFTLANTHPK